MRIAQIFEKFSQRTRCNPAEGKLIQRLGKYAPVIMAILGMMLSIAAFFPGFMTNDSFDQLAQARTGIFSDWAPPVMAFLWRYVDMVIRGPFGMLFLQTLLWWSSLAIIVLCVWRKHWFASIAIAIIGFWPSSFSMFGFIWKDIQMTAFLAMAIALIFLAVERDSRWPLICALPFLLYGTAVRHNAIFAAFPIVLWLGWLLTKDIRSVPWRGSAVLLFSVVMLLCPQAMNRSLATIHRLPSQQLLLFDLAGVSSQVNTNFIPIQYQPYCLPMDTLRKKYDPALVGFLYWGPDSKTNLLISSDPNYFASLKKQWCKVIPTHMMAYLRHRLGVFTYQLGLGSNAPWSYVKPALEYRKDFGIAWDPSIFSKSLFDSFDRINTSILFRPYPYLLILLGCFVLSVKGALKGVKLPLLAMMFALSGLMYQCSYLLISLGSDLRFCHWVIICACFAPMVLLNYFFMPTRERCINDDREALASPYTEASSER